ncbi:YadA family autotransporter adhesin [Acinetobacter sp. MD2(2019)]|uniref:YadA family autotransporter adhesin n=1 Tax=Acinetobacter sp. MD2(2019) TaxID=2605273 RepID=UPI003B63C456
MGQTATGGIALINGITANESNAGSYNLDTNSAGVNSIAIGSLSTIASAQNAIAIGNSANVNQINGVAIGNAATVSYRAGSIAIGNNAQVVLGSHVNDVNGLPGSIAIGLNARSIGGSETVIGAYAGAGAQRYDDGVKNGYGSDSVLIGDQAGRNSQYLYATYVGDEAGRNSIGQHNSYVGQNAARWRTGNYNVALGSNALVGISNTQNSTGNNNTAIGTATGVRLEGDYNSLLGGGAGSNVKGNYNTFSGVGTGSNVNGNYNTATGTYAGLSTTGHYNVSMGYFSGLAVSANSTVAIGSYAAANKDNAVALGSNSSTNTDATTVANATLNGLTYGDFAGQVTDAGMQVSVGAVGAERQIKNVGSGAIAQSSTDAINGSQLYATNAVLGNVGNSITSILGGNAVLNQDGNIIYTNIGGTGQNTIDEAIKYVTQQTANANQGWKLATDSGSSATSTVLPNDTVSINGDTVSGVTVTNTGNNITVGLSDQIQVGTGSNAVSIDGNAGTIQAGDVAIDGANGNITAGQVTVNGQAGTVNGLSNTTWDADNIVSGQAATEDQLKQVVQNAAQAATAAKSTVTAGDNITVTPSTNTDGSTNYQVATQKDVTFDTVKSGSVTSDKVTVGNVVIDQAGINAGGNKVTNVANGSISSTSTDAVNGSQLYTTNNNISNYLGGGSTVDSSGNVTAPTYSVAGGTYNNVGDALGAVDTKITNVQNNLDQAFYNTNKRIDDVEKHANAGTAQALATAGLPQAYIPGKSMMAISGGTFRGESGYAIGLSSISDNGKWVFKASGSGSTRGDFGGTVGAGIQW